MTNSGIRIVNKSFCFAGSPGGSFAFQCRTLYHFHAISLSKAISFLVLPIDHARDSEKPVFHLFCFSETNTSAQEQMAHVYSPRLL